MRSNSKHTIKGLENFIETKSASLKKLEETEKQFMLPQRGLMRLLIFG